MVWRRVRFFTLVISIAALMIIVVITYQRTGGDLNIGETFQEAVQKVRQQLRNLLDWIVELVKRMLEGIEGWKRPR